MASTGFLTSKSPGTPTCHRRNACLTGSFAAQSCVPVVGPAELLQRHATLRAACSSNLQQHCSQAAARETSRNVNMTDSSSGQPSAINSSSSSSKPNSWSAQVRSTATAAGRVTTGSSNSRSHQQHSRKGNCNGDNGKQRPSGADLMRQLKAADSWQQLQQFVEQHVAQLNPRHSSALITHLAQITAARPQQLQQQVEQQAACLMQEQEDEQQQQLPKQPGLEFDPLPDLQAATAAAAGREKGPRLSASTGSSSGDNNVAIDPGLQHFLTATIAPLVDAHLQQYDARGLANTAWALARLQPVLQASGSATPGGGGGGRCAAACPYPGGHWLELFCQVSQPLLLQCDAQQLSNTLWALVQLQHHPPNSWLESWYAAFRYQAGFRGTQPSDSSSSRSDVQLQSLSSALWSVAQLQSRSSNGSCLRPPDGWVTGLLHRSVDLLQQTSPSSNSSSKYKGSGDSQAISNLLWSCALLQQQPLVRLLQMVQHHAQMAAAAVSIQQGQQVLSDQALSNLMWSLARLSRQLGGDEGSLPICNLTADTAAVEDADKQRRQSSRHCSTSGSSRTSNNSTNTNRVGRLPPTSSTISGSSSSRDSVVVCSCGDALLAAATGRIVVMNWRHVATVTWAAGVLQLHCSSEWVSCLQQRLQQPAVNSIQDQELALILWGLSRMKATQPSLLQQQHRQSSAISNDSSSSDGTQQHIGISAAPGVGLNQGQLQQLLEALQVKLPSYSTLALHSILLSLGRLRVSPSEALLQAWLKEIARRNYLTAAGGQAMANVCCGLVHLRKNQAAGQAGNNSSGSSTNSSLGSRRTASRRLGFLQCQDADWLAGFCTASASRLGLCTVQELSVIGWALAALGFLPPAAWVLAWQSAVAGAAAAAVPATAATVPATATSAAAAARALWALKQLPAVSNSSSQAAAAVRLLGAVTAAAAVGKCDGQTLAVAVHSAAGIHQGEGEQQDDSSNLCLRPPVQQLLQQMVPELISWTSQQLLMLLTAAAALRAEMPGSLLLAAMQHAQSLAQQQQLSNRSVAGILEAVAKLHASRNTAAVPEQLSGTVPQQQQVQQRVQQLTRSQVSQWVTAMLRAFTADSASSDELSMVLWSLAVFEYHPGVAWFNNQWLKHSQQQLPRFSASQLATCGWALTAVNHNPPALWSRVWTEAVRSQMSAASPSQLALLLYAAATMACRIDKPWLLAAAVSAANSIRRWSCRDLSLGLWGLAQLGLRAVADAELLEALFGQLKAQQIVAGMQQLSPHQLLQLLQAVVLLRPPAAPGTAAAAVVGTDDRWEQGNPLMGSAVTGNMMRRLRWRARTTARQADAAAAAAVAAARHHQQLLVIQSTSSGSSSGREDLMVAAAAAHEAAAAWRRAVTAAAAAAATLVSATSHRSPDAVGISVDSGWMISWWQAAANQMHRWSPSVAAAALSAVAALGVPPPLAWQQQLLSEIVRKHKHLTTQEFTMISNALDLLRSPLKQQWTREIQSIHAAAAAAAGASADPADQRQQMTNLERKRLWQQRWLRQRRQQKSLLHQVHSRNGNRQRRLATTPEGIRYPQKLSSSFLLKVRQQHRTVRLVAWWRRQQQLLHQQRQQRLLQQQQTHGAAAVPGAHTRRNSPHRQRTATTSSSNSSWGASKYSRSMFSYTPVSSVDIVGTTPHSSSSSSSRSSDSGGVAPVGGLASRKLNDCGRHGLQLAERPVLRPVQAAAVGGGTVSNSERPQASTGGAEGESESTGCNVHATAAAVSPPQLLSGGNGTAASNHLSLSPEACLGAVNSSSGSNGKMNGSKVSAADLGTIDSVVVGADGAVQPVWESLNAGAAAENGSSLVDLGGVYCSMHTLAVGSAASQYQSAVSCQPQFRQLSWACQLN